MKILRRTQFGNPILRQVARRLTKQEILSDEVQQLIADMQYTLQQRKYGVGLAAPQVGRPLALALVAIHPVPWRDIREETDMVVINPEIVATYGRRTAMWEGCISYTGTYAKALRYRKVRVRYLDEKAEEHEADFEGLVGHVLQHETDHLNGVLFVDHVRDTKTYITISEYNKRYRKKPVRL